MKEGFYFHRNNIHYGCYDEKQVSGKGNILMTGPDRIQTNHPIHKVDWAVQVWDNFSLLEPEYTDLQVMLLKMGAFMNLSPDHEEYFTSAEHFLPLDKIYVEQKEERY